MLAWPLLAAQMKVVWPQKIFIFLVQQIVVVDLVQIDKSVPFVGDSENSFTAKTAFMGDCFIARG